MTDSHMHPISDTLDRVKAKLLAGLPPEEAPIVAWSWIAGQKVAENALAMRFADGVLTVTVADDGWRRELTGMAASYVARINQVLPEGVRVGRIAFEKG